MEISHNPDADLQHFFVIRLWREPGGEETPSQWRGSVEHTETKKKIYFRELTTLLEFIEHFLDDQTTFINSKDKKHGF